MGRAIDADVLKAAFELDGYKSPYVTRLIDACPTVAIDYDFGRCWIATNEGNEDALRFLCKSLKEAKIALGRAESRPGVTQEEIENLERKIAAIDWMIPLVMSAKEE